MAVRGRRRIVGFKLKGRIKRLPHPYGRISADHGVRSLFDLQGLKLCTSTLSDLFEKFGFAASEALVRLLDQEVLH